MQCNIFAKISDTSSNAYVSIEEVSQCPICKHAIKPVIISSTIFKDSEDKLKLAVTNLCRACNNTFINQYKNLSGETLLNGYVSYKYSKFDYSAPNKFIEQEFDDLIKNTSPNFVKIYNQAYAAEAQNLDEIAGIGYRKALEFLIKDFLILQNPNKDDAIKGTPLGSCVNNYIDNPQLKIAASRAIWLGNDQTHYIQKFNDKDITDLKRLIRLTVHWISMLLETEVAATIEPIK